MSVVTPARSPASISAFLAHSLSVWPVPPIFAAVEVIAASRIYGDTLPIASTYSPANGG
jgi:hypothetical protein